MNKLKQLVHYSLTKDFCNNYNNNAKIKNFEW